RPLEAKTGILTYVSLTRGADGVRITTYLAPECYGIANDTFSRASGTRRIGVGGGISEELQRLPATPQAAAPTNLEQVLERHLETLTRHPFMQRFQGQD